MDGDETQSLPVPATEPEPGPVSWERAKPRYFGLTPSGLAGALAALCLVAAVGLLATGRTAAAVLLFVAAALLAALFAEQARRRRQSAFDRIAAAAVDNTRALAGFTGASVRAWSGAGREVARLRLEAGRLVRERSQLQVELGGAAYAEDAPRVEELRTRMRELTERIDACAAEAVAVVEQARARTSRERIAVGSTEIRPPG